MTDGDFCNHIHPASHSGVAGKGTFKKVKITGLFSFSAFMWKDHRKITLVSSLQAHWHGFSDSQHFVVKLNTSGTC